ncbi:MAG: chloride channel protein [Bacteroidetes bacterium]|nr:chloride channel protein [Bacteroidota bacterium]
MPATISNKKRRSRSVLARFLVWRVKNIGDRNYILILSIIVGLASGCTALILKTAVYHIHDLFLNHRFNTKDLLLLVYPVIGIALTVAFKKYILKDQIKHNISSILHAISKRNSLMRAHKVFSSIFGGILTAGFGGSIGLESPIISSGSAIGSNLGRVLRLNYKTVTLLLACGAAGAISAIFNTPVAAIVFALEVLLIDLTSFSLIPLLMASASGAIVTRIFFEKEIVFHFTLIDDFQISHLPFYILLGIICGFISYYFTVSFLFVESKFEFIKKNRYRLIIGGLILGILVFLFPPLYGEGYEIVKQLLAGNHSEVFENSLYSSLSDNIWMPVFFFLVIIFLKVIATATTLGAGGIGGIFAPSIFTGSFTGFLFAHVFNAFEVGLSRSNFSLVGMAAVLAGVLHAPLTGVFLIAEITSGYELIVPLMIATAISFVTSKYLEPNSIFTMQLAKRGELITHHKDKAVLTFMELRSVIETDLKTISPDATLNDLVKVIAKSKRNIFPVVDDEGMLAGIVMLDNVREIMFDKSMYHTRVSNLMILPPTYISSTDSMEVIMEKFKDSDAWNLPIIDDGKYVGFISKSKLFTAYRNLLVEISEE